MLKIDDFKLNIEEYEMEVEYSAKFLELLKKDGYERVNSTSNKTVLKYYNLNYKLWSIEINLTFDEHEYKEYKNLIDKINFRLNWLKLNKEEIDKKIVKDLLLLKNEEWLLDDEVPYSAISFLKSIKLERIEFFGDGSFAMSFNDGALFGNHCLILDIDSDFEMNQPFAIEG